MHSTKVYERRFRVGQLLRVKRGCLVGFWMARGGYVAGWRCARHAPVRRYGGNAGGFLSSGVFGGCFFVGAFFLFSGGGHSQVRDSFFALWSDERTASCHLLSIPGGDARASLLITIIGFPSDQRRFERLLIVSRDRRHQIRLEPYIYSAAELAAINTAPLGLLGGYGSASFRRVGRVFGAFNVNLVRRCGG